MRVMVFACLCALAAPMVQAGTLTPATGGEAIPESTAGGAYTELEGPVYEEDSAGDVGEGSIILSLPPDFEWDTASQPRARVESLGGGGQNINRTPDGGAIQASSVSASEIRFDINRSTRGRKTNRLTFENLRVRPVDGASEAAGEIVHTGDAAIDSVDANTTSWGSLRMEGADGGEGGNVTLAANGETQGPVDVLVGDEVDLGVSGSDCPSADEWRYQWEIDGEEDTSATQTQSPCEQPFSRTETFDSVGLVSVMVEAEYRRCLFQLFGGCFVWGDWQSHGEDSLDLDVTEESQLDHFELAFDETALTCQPLGVDIRACANEDCSELYSEPVDVSLSPDGWQGGNTVTLTDGTGSKAFQRTQPGDVTLGVASSEPPKRPLTDNLCQSGAGSPSTDQCEVNFRDSGLAVDVPDQTASRPSEPIAIQAVQRDDETNACVPAFSNVERDVDFWSQYIEPDGSDRPASRNVRVESTDIGRSESDATPVTLEFDETGTAEIELNYPDAGRMGLNARYEGSGETEDEGLELPLFGDSQWVSVPRGFCVETGFECEAGDASCAAEQVAAETFDLSVTAVGWQEGGNDDLCSGNPSTPNFEMSDIPLDSELVAPAAGSEGELALSGYDHGASADGEVTIQQAISEVGVFRFDVVPGEGAYFGRTVPDGSSEPSGRVIPDRFDVTVTDPGSLDPYCDASDPFAYSGQSLNWLLEPELRITALNTEDQRTRNYTEPGFLRLVPEDVAREAPSEDAEAVDLEDAPYPVATALETGLFLSQEQGRITYGFSGDDTLRYVKTPDSRVAPFEPEAPFEVTDVTDEDGVTATDLPGPFTPVADFELRYGRLAVANAYGPETRPLVLPMEAQFWNGEAFRRHQDEGCWSYDTGEDVSLEPEDLTAVSGADGTLLAGQPMEDARLVLEAPGAGNTGEVRATFSVPVWLQDDFNNEGTLVNPSGLATFGVYRGHDRIIYWREVQ